MILLHVLAFVAGSAIVASTLLSAIKTFVLPRSANTRLTRVVFQVTAIVFRSEPFGERTYARRDRVMALYAPVSLIILPSVWLALVSLGYMGIYWALGAGGWRAAFTLSGSSLLTLGFASSGALKTTVLAFTEATVGLILVALLISYLPTMYSAFSRREATVSMLSVRAGTPPSPVRMLTAYHALGRLDALTELWATWEAWFAELAESHTSLAALPLFRSSKPGISWITAAGAVLDAAALTVATADLPRNPQAELCIASGFRALRDIADFFFIQHDPNPAPDDPISVTRAEFDAVCDALAAADFPLKPDRDRAWRDFAGWRVNYDRVLIALAYLRLAPPAPWSSDRVKRRPPRIFLPPPLRRILPGARDSP